MGLGRALLKKKEAKKIVSTQRAGRHTFLEKNIQAWRKGGLLIRRGGRGGKGGEDKRFSWWRRKSRPKR